jgi:translation initiation factor IF-1
MKLLKIGFIRKIQDGIYYVEIENGEVVECKFSNKARSYYDHELTIDERVQIELYALDHSIGRIEPRGFVY